MGGLKSQSSKQAVKQAGWQVGSRTPLFYSLGNLRLENSTLLLEVALDSRAEVRIKRMAEQKRMAKARKAEGRSRNGQA